MEQKKKMKEAYAEIEDMFHAIPELERIFKKYEWEIRYYGRVTWSACTTKEKLIKKRDDFLALAKSIDNRDLLILYYIKHLDKLGTYKVLYALREMYRAQCKEKNKLNNTEEYVDIVEIGWRL